MNIEEYKKRNCFTTPDGYFEQLASEIEHATSKNVAARSKTRSLTQRVVGIMSYAAMVAIVAIVATSIIFNSRNNDLTATIEELDDSEFIDNMLNSYPIDEYTFYCYFTGTEQ